MFARALIPFLGIACWTAIAVWIGILIGRESGRTALRRRLMETRSSDIPKDIVAQWAKEL